MCKIIKAILLMALLSGCEDCSQPTRMVCAQMRPIPIITYNPVLKRTIMTTMVVCDEYKEAPNECYRKEK